MNRLRIAIVGAGTGRGQLWLSTLRKLSDFSELYEFCALCEVIPERAKENAERWGVKPYTNLRTMLEEDKPDVLLNGIAPDSNTMATGLAAKHGVHVINEIPIAPTLPAADFMIRTTQEHGVKLEITEQVYLWAREQLKRKIIDAGVIGEITHTRLRYTNKADYHGINAVRMLVRQPVKRVLGYVGRAAVPEFVGYEGDLVKEDFWDFAIMEFQNGVVCLFEDPPRAGLPSSWDIHGSKGQIIGNDLYVGAGEDRRHFPIQVVHTEIDGEKVLEHMRVDTDPPVVFENSFTDYRASDNDEVARMQLLVGFHRAITEDAEPEYGALNARQDLEILFALRESARRNSTWMDLPLTEITELEKRLHNEFFMTYGGGPEQVDRLTGVAFPRGGVRWTVAGWD
ncbi:MAG: Gfo/Idh/MocA family oxidoreductase [Planctomycetes bacterium]|nr:Gfo/Idh/MocA family oxidoreductase [Planctomycetota bacterium]